jgi:thiol-disulfide isomerase/thioredoxin
VRFSRSTLWVTGLVALTISGCVPQLTSSGIDGGPWQAPANRWNVSDPPEDLVNVGFSVGQTPPDFRLLDQFGEEVSLWQFYGRVVLLDVSTMWCGPCQEVASHTQNTFEEHVDDGFMYLTVLHEDVENRPPTQDDLNLWADYYQIKAPVLADGDQATGLAVTQGQYPAVMVIGRDMKIATRPRSLDEGSIYDAIIDAL